METESTQVDGADGGLRGWDLTHRDYWVDPAGHVRYAVKVPRAAAALDTTVEALRVRLRNGTLPGRKKMVGTREEWTVLVRDINRDLGLGDDLEWIPEKAERPKEGSRA